MFQTWVERVETKRQRSATPLGMPETTDQVHRWGIDKWVYQLYRLSEEEIMIIEGAR